MGFARGGFPDDLMKRFACLRGFQRYVDSVTFTSHVHRTFYRLDYIRMQMQVPPKVSVAIPVYNGEPYLAEAIESVLAQSYADFELVICDNASTDRTVEIARSYADPRIRILQNERNLGFGPNWNRCLDEVRGSYIKILPHDDLLHPRCLAEQVRSLDGDLDHSIALVFCARHVIGPSGRLIVTRGLHRSKPSFTGLDMARQTARRGTNPIGEPGAVLFRASAAKAAGHFNETRPFVIDIDFWLRLLKFGNAIRLPEALASFRISPNSHSVKIARQQASDYYAFLDDLKRNNLYPLSRTDLQIGRLAALANGFGRALFYRFAMENPS